jgi:hypothetical protein
MQRLFSMFPAGAAGVGLLCTRLSVIASLFLGVQLTQSSSPLVIWAVGIMGLLLAVGFATPICASICCVAEAYVLVETYGMHPMCVSASALVALALALLGPGAYSVDARLFGRKIVVFKGGRE